MSRKQISWAVGFAALLCISCTAVQAAIEYENVTIKEIADGNSTFLGKAVVIEGDIIKECQGRGCWFILDDGTGSVFVDLKPNNFTIPLNLIGSKARVYGNVTVEEERRLPIFDPGTPFVIGKRVELMGKFNSPLVVTG
ncbi:MAG TPA: DUF4920 domain-containing protein [Methanotrichaceae archaeon]|nr:DUF4920 domain-containing protein [Methanotrichaceae archaeon]